MSANIATVLATVPTDRSTLALLRAATADAHVRLEARFDVAAAAASPVTWEAVLRGFLAVVEPLELAAIAGAPQGVVGRPRAAALRRDLAWLAAPAPPTAPVVRLEPAEAAGTLYVLEGSALGGAVVAATVRRHAPALAGATSYFAGDGRPAAPWRAFTHGLAAWDAGPAERERAAAGAVAAFEALEAELESRGALV